MQSSAKAKKHKELPDLAPEIEEKVRSIESGKVMGKKYTPDECIKHIDQVLED